MGFHLIWRGSFDQRNSRTIPPAARTINLPGRSPQTQQGILRAITNATSELPRTKGRCGFEDRLGGLRVFRGDESAKVWCRTIAPIQGRLNHYPTSSMCKEGWTHYSANRTNGQPYRVVSIVSIFSERISNLGSNLCP